MYIWRPGGLYFYIMRSNIMENYCHYIRRSYGLLMLSCLVLIIGDKMSSLVVVEGLACNWGTRATHPLPPDIVVKLMKDNGFNKVKLFEAESWALEALGNSGIQVMLGIPNDFLAPLSTSVRVAEDWVSQNVSSYISKHGVDIRYVTFFFLFPNYNVRNAILHKTRPVSILNYYILLVVQILMLKTCI